MSCNRRKALASTAVRWAAAVALLSALAGPLECAGLLPKQLHCTSILYLFNHYEEGGPLLSYRKTALAYYQVDETLDLGSGRSSLLLRDGNSDDVTIYYNQLDPSSELGSGRKFIAYDPLRSSCKERRIDEWPLAELRRVAISMNIERDFEGVHVDVPIGPSGLLYAIENQASGFRYRGSLMSRSRLTMVDVFRRRFMHSTLTGYGYITIVVHVVKRGLGKTLKVDDLLSELYEHERDESGASSRPLDVALVGACQVLGEDDEPPRDNSNRPLSFDPNFDGDRAADDSKLDLQLDEDTFCARDQTLFVAHYNVLAAYSTGTLLGRSLEDLGESPYDFQREPFVQPAGIGCWSSLAEQRGWQKSLTRDNSMAQLSGEFVGEFGAKGLSFVAYDGERGLLRLDRNGRKSVYDLAARKAYHVGEFAAPHEHLGATGAIGRDKSQAGGAAFEEPLERCVQLDIAASGRLVSERDGVVEELLGLRRGSERHLGSRMLDHVHYEVFELEMGARVPILLQLPNIRMLAGNATTAATSSGLKFFITYYAQSIGQRVDSSSSTKNGQDSQAIDRRPHPLLLSFVELWEFEPVRGRRRLLNRLKFAQFSWQLDVEPTNDPASQRSSDPNMRLFEMEACYQDRASQAELVVDLKREAPRNSEPSDELLASLRQSRRQINERLHSLLASTLEVSRLNLVGLRLRVLDSADMVAMGRIVELREGLSDLQILGHARFSADTFDAHLQRVFHNRHSLEECQLDSLAWSRANWFAYCHRLAICIILVKEEALRGDLKRGEMAPEDREAADICQAYSFRYSTLDEGCSKKQALKQAEMNQFALGRQKLQLVLTSKAHDRLEGREVEAPPGGGDGEVEDDERTGDDRTGGNNRTGNAYQAKLALRELRLLDTIGSRLRNEAALLDGMRYSTTREEPAARNLNTRVAVPWQTRMGTFRYCQLACQMDDLCGSFSVCARNGKDDDCVLASVRLTGERLGLLLAGSARDRKAAKFEVKVTSAQESQVFLMYHDPSCSLHPKDFVAEYEVRNTYINWANRASSLAQTGPLKVGSGGGGGGGPPVQRRHVSLDDCAGLSYERGLFRDPTLTNFTYCPLESLCSVAGDELDARSHLQQLDGFCYLYKRRSTRAYETKRMTHLVVTRKADPSTQATGTEGAAAAAASVPNMSGVLNPFKEAARMSEEKLARSLWGLSEQSCARECNLHKANCLAFDSCRQAGRVLCVLYSIRSPLVAATAYLPQLEVERTSWREHNIVLTNNLMCDHHYLKPDYFEVRLQRLLQLEGNGIVTAAEAAAGGNGSRSADDNADREKRLEALEQQIVDEDKQRSGRQLEQLELEAGNQQTGSAGARPAPEAGGQSGRANEWFHFASLLFGLLLGALATLFRQQIAAGASNGYRWYRARRGVRANEGLTNRLVLDEPFS